MTKITHGKLIQTEGILANILQQMYAYEDNIFECIANFIHSATSLPIYLKDKPFVAPESNNPYLTIRMITSNNSNGWGQNYQMQEDGSMQYVIDNTYQIEIMAYRGRALPTLNYLLGCFYSMQELAYQTLYTKGISFLSCSNITEANTVLDGNNTRLGARMVATFNTRMIVEDMPTTEIVKVKYTLNAYPDTYEADPLSIKGDVEYTTT